MGQVLVEIGGRNYPLSCRDGDEGHLTALAGEIAAKAEGLTRSLGPMSESRLLLMAALVVADELHDARKGKFPGWAPPRAAETAPRSLETRPATDPEAERAIARLAALVTRAERLADTIDA